MEEERNYHTYSQSKLEYSETAEGAEVLHTRIQQM